MLSPCPTAAARRRPRARAAVLPLAATFALAGLAACGGPQAPEGATDPAPAAAESTVELGCDDRSALAPDEATALAEAASRTLRWVREGELELLWGSLHPQARHPDQRDAFGTAIASVGERLGRASPALNVLDVRRIRVRGTATGAQEVVCPATPANEALTWFGNVGDEDVAVVIVEARIDPFLEAAVVQLRRHADEWRLVGLSTSPSAYRGRRAAAWEAAASAAETADDPLVAVATATVAQRLADRGASVVTAAKLRLDAQVARLRAGPLAARLAQPWTLADGTSVVIHDLALAITPDAMVPVLRFVRPAPGDEADAQATIDGLMSAVRERAGGLAEHFDAVLFEAYDERPVDPAVEYRAFRAARFFDPASDPRGLGAWRAGDPAPAG